MRIITLNISDYRAWDGNYIHKSIGHISELNKYTIKVNNKVVPCFISKREPNGYWGYIDEEGEEWKVIFT